MSLVPEDLPSLDLRPFFVTKTITDLLSHLSSTPNASHKSCLLEDFLNRLELELDKIQAFQRELPLCMFLLNDDGLSLFFSSSFNECTNTSTVLVFVVAAISALKAELEKCRTYKSEPVLEEFIPLKKEYQEKKVSEKEKECRDNNNWTSSFQLWNTDEAYKRDNAYRLDQQQNKSNEEERQSVAKDYFQYAGNRNVERGFVMPLSTYLLTKEECDVNELSLQTPETAVRSKRERCGSRITSCRVVSSISSHLLQPQSGRKQRRCWSPELHHRFVKALEELGGSQAATPKQIRELMRVDGLTNDEVKSHLQKYRLHTRRVPVATTAGGLWMHKESLKGSSSGSPQGPLQLATQSGEATSRTEGGNMIDDDVKSEDGFMKRGFYRFEGPVFLLCYEFSNDTPKKFCERAFEKYGIIGDVEWKKIGYLNLGNNAELSVSASFIELAKCDLQPRDIW
ncbi:unnamed protein product [Sphenostylis stenocarpa]|uniref:HTH myb-type domain-containing protein n=1 Tax=Sphenostylis stenocarpa TaxID=92480 RepID=A0AA86VWU2_9FABA|nr:unnamed protein product [Sphenostylis stenocarpa]